MAVMIPDSLPLRNMDGERITAGERRFFALLQRLPDDCIVYYEPVVRHRHPDFVLILPEAGVLIIEVKGWWHKELKAANPKTVTLNRRGKETNEKHPGEQARDYMCLTMDKCREHPLAQVLIQTEGTYKNRIAFPFGYASVLSNINRSQLEKGPREFAKIFSPAKTVTKDQLAELETLSADELAARLKSYFDPWWAFPKLTLRQIDVIRATIHPEVVLRQTENELPVLDQRQEGHARAIGSGHRVVYGVAGSGKTVMLVARAKLLAEEHGKKVLLLCHNRLLASDLAVRVEGYKHIKAMTFYGWGVRNGAEIRAGEADDAYGERLLRRLKDGGRDCGQFDAVLIDEAQDWQCSWFHCAKHALKEPETGDLLIVGDGSQALYQARDFKWVEAGVKAKGRTISAKFDLYRNYRNTVEILRAARPFSARPKRGQSGENVEALAVDPDNAIRNGPEPEMVELDNAREECLYAAALIESWLRGGVEIRGRRERIAARDIAILYPRLRAEADIAALVERLNGFTRAVRLTPKEKATGTLLEDGVRILTIKSSRGLQFRLVVLLWADLLPYEPQKNERSELYVAMTRAEDMLVILHSGHSAYIDELRENNSAGSLR